ncbi:penicillin amidase [Hoeflea marina]|uniref:Penicillin amidase n=1 Tax=Hoeflea marina TaxID=274592 RepID=A0A317PYC7_9HYPH|nr:penicillin acylase family protein [Hoeflea marina]PWW04510.1 penicillin amidase [Hoeflea marina]
MRRLFKVLIRLILVLVPILVMAAGAGMLWMSRSLAPLDGSIEIVGLSGPVSIARDSEGVPHIAGETRGDVAAGLGFVHAQERLWQMEVSRMAGKGRLSEMFGKATIGTDIWLRTMAIDKAAEASMAVIDADTMAMLEGYSRGVNAWMDRNPQSFSSKLPPEFVILGHQPEPWTPVDTLICLKMMSVQLSENAGDEVLRLAFARMGMSEAEANDLMPYLVVDTPPPLPDLTPLLGLDTTPLGAPVTKAEAGSGASGLGANSYAMIDAVMGTGASNNWVVSGSRTQSGKPVLANDPHLGLMAPSIWYLAHLEVTSELGEPRHLIGASLPGSPYVLLGRNNDIAWGFTNTATDAQDIFVERVNPDNADEYLTPSGWAKFGAQEEVIKVHGAPDTVFTRRWTRHGPVLPASYKKLDKLLPENSVAALQWVALASDDTTANAGPRLFTFRTVSDYQDGMEPFLTPMQSMVVADTTGNIGLIAPGRVPVRDPANQVMGRAPVPGWNAIYDWRGFVPYAELPRLTNPPVGAIGTANTKIVGPDYPHFLTFDWDEPFRQQRVDTLVINAREKHTPEISREAQADVYSAAFVGLKGRFARALAGKQLTTLQQGLLSRIEAWDGQMTADKGEPLIFLAWVRHMMINTFSDDLGPVFDDWFKPRINVLSRLVDGGTARNWCDVKDTPDEESCDALLIASLDDAVADLRARYGDNIDAWRWGTAHVQRGAHQPFAEVDWLAGFFNVDVEAGGGPFTLDRGVTHLENDNAPYVGTNAASFRGIYDLSDLDKSTFIQTTGQSGNVFSRHYRDMAQRWADVKSITIPTTGAGDVEGHWQLTPE